MKNKITGELRINQFQGGYYVSLWTDYYYVINGCSSRLAPVLKTYYGIGSKKRCENWIKTHRLS